MQISYEITKDPKLLEEYYQVREQCYQRELKLPSFDGSEEAADRYGDIFVARENTRCLGGARIVGNENGLFSSLSFADLMEQLNLLPGQCCVWERLAVSQTFRESQRQPEFCDYLIQVSRSLGYDYAFMVSSVRNARFYRLCHSTLNIPFQICHGVECAPRDSFAQLEHVLSVAHLNDSAMEIGSRANHYFTLNQQPHYSVAA